MITGIGDSRLLNEVRLRSESEVYIFDNGASRKATVDEMFDEINHMSEDIEYLVKAIQKGGNLSKEEWNKCEEIAKRYSIEV